MQRFSRLAWGGGVSAMVLTLAAPAPAADFADLVVVGGKVITVDAQQTIAAGVAVRGNRIVAVGDVSALKGPSTRVVDLKGRALLPGFIDAHSHVEGMADVESHFINIQAPPLKDGKAIIAKLKEAQAKLPAERLARGAGDLQPGHADTR